MKRKIFGIKIGTILTVVFCLIAAVIFWLFVKYSGAGASLTASTMLSQLRGFV